MAVAASSLRLSTTLSAVGDGGPASNLWAGLTWARRKGLPREMLQVTRWPDQDPDCAVRVLLTVADPKHVDFTELPIADAYVLAIAAGVATADDISRVALAADAADVTLSGVILANPGEWDEDAGPQPLAGLDGPSDVAEGQAARSSGSDGGGRVSGTAS
jgi:hypothetical protein